MRKMIRKELKAKAIEVIVVAGASGRVFAAILIMDHPGFSPCIISASLSRVPELNHHAAAEAQSPGRQVG